MRLVAILLLFSTLLTCTVSCSAGGNDQPGGDTDPTVESTDPADSTQNQDTTKNDEEEIIIMSKEQYPFPHNTGYPYGILPSVSQDEMNQAVQRMYDDWAEVYLTKEGCFKNELRVSGGHGDNYKMGTCSEGTGYGMLLAVYMASPDNNCHEQYDAMYRFVKRNMVPGYGLMKWVTNKLGISTNDWPAPDGDLDIALSLLMAHKQWGSDGEINYLEEGIKYVNNIMKHAVNYPNYSVARGMLTDPVKHYNSYTMTSYQMPGHARLFREISEDADWDKVLEEFNRIYDYFNKLNPESALTPYVFMINDYKPVEGKGYTYSYDSCRVPWRLATDYVWYGKDEAGIMYDMLNTNATWFAKYMKSIGWNFDNVAASFNLDGSPAANYSSPRTIATMISLSAMVDESHRELLDKAYNYMSNLDMMHDHPGDYFQDTLLMMSMLLITGNMPNFYDIEPHPDNKLEVVKTDTTAPTKPEGLTLVSATSNSVKLNWNASTDDSGSVVYRVYRDNKYCYYATSKAGNCTVKNLDPGKTYEFKVYAVDRAGNRTESDSITVTTSK